MTENPPTSYITSWQQAEEMAADWLFTWGWRDARLTAGGADGGLDVVAAGAAAQVKWEGSAAGRPAMQKLVGAAPPGAELIFFAAGGFTRQAVDYANERWIALFTYDPLGNVTAHNQAASQVLRRGHDGPDFPGYAVFAPGPLERWLDPRVKAATGKGIREWLKWTAAPSTYKPVVTKGVQIHQTRRANVLARSAGDRRLRNSAFRHGSAAILMFVCVVAASIDLAQGEYGTADTAAGLVWVIFVFAVVCTLFAVRSARQWSRFKGNGADRT